MYEISEDVWRDVTSNKSGNLFGPSEIIEFGRRGKLEVVLHDGTRFRPIIGVEGLATYLKVSGATALDLSKMADLKPCGSIAKFFDAEAVFKSEAVDNAMHCLAAKGGLDIKYAALELGLTANSFEKIANHIPYNSQGRFLKEFLLAFRNAYLPKFKTWSSRTTLLLEFITNYNQSIGDKSLEPQFCEFDTCENLAHEQCANTINCRFGNTSRFICPAHSEWIDSDTPIDQPPEVLCPNCAGQARLGILPFKLLGDGQ